MTAFALAAGMTPPAVAQAAGLSFGMGGAPDLQEALGVTPTFSQIWAGPWNHPHGWASISERVAAAADGGGVPVVEWFYWGNDISPACIQSGCGSGKDAKSFAEWQAAAAAMADAVHQGLAGRTGIIVIETEFNKKGVEHWEVFDGYLADHARLIRQHAPEARLALGFGNWGNESWPRFDRAMAEMDLAGLQTMRASTRNSQESYLATPDRIEGGVRRLADLFGKPVILHDLALSSYGGFETQQETVVQEILAREERLRKLGLEGVVYRALRDNAKGPTNDYFGEGERHFGLQYADGAWKPALDEWIEGARAPEDGPPPVGPWLDSRNS